MLIDRITVILVELKQAPGVAHRGEHPLQKAYFVYAPEYRTELTRLPQDFQEESALRFGQLVAGLIVVSRYARVRRTMQRSKGLKRSP